MATSPDVEIVPFCGEWKSTAIGKRLVELELGVSVSPMNACILVGCTMYDFSHFRICMGRYNLYVLHTILMLGRAPSFHAIELVDPDMVECVNTRVTICTTLSDGSTVVGVVSHDDRVVTEKKMDSVELSALCKSLIDCLDPAGLSK